MRKLILPPDEDKFQLVPGNVNLSTGREQGRMRVRHLLNGTPHVATLQWNVVGSEFDYLRAFWRTGTKFGALPFLIDLPVNNYRLIEHKAMFVQDSFAFAGVNPIQFNVTAKALVVPA